MVTATLTVLATVSVMVGGCTAAKNPSGPSTTERVKSAIPSEGTSGLAVAGPEHDWSTFDSTSIRNPNDGWLRGGVPLPLSAPGLRFNPARDPAARYGTVEVVRALLDAADQVRRELGGVPITINDLSLERGGPIPHHRSHQSGRDVDVLFYQLGPEGNPIQSVGAFFDPSGAGVDFRDLQDPSDDVSLQLDIPRTWRFLRALIEGEQAQLQNVYVAEHIRALLLSYARASSASESTLRRFEAITCQPSYPHDDHFHFRFFCTADDIARGCRDAPPIYPWQRVRLERAGTQPLPLAPKREQATTRVVTHEEAREAAGPMDPEVIRWLDRRAQWIRKPHPGRPYCP